MFSDVRVILYHKLWITSRKYAFVCLKPGHGSCLRLPRAALAFASATRNSSPSSLLFADRSLVPGAPSASAAKCGVSCSLVSPTRNASCHPCPRVWAQKWRRERDSNPRNACALTRFPIVPIQPALASLRRNIRRHPARTRPFRRAMPGWYFHVSSVSLRLPRKNFFIKAAQRSASIPPITAIL